MYVSFAGRPTNLEPISVKTCVLYDPQDGRIAHIHRVTSLPGSRERSRSEVEEIAVASARRNHVSNLHVLHPSGEEFNYEVGKRYRVDLQRMLIEEVPDTRREDLRGRSLVRNDRGKNFLLWTLAIVALAILILALTRC